MFLCYDKQTWELAGLAVNSAGSSSETVFVCLVFRELIGSLTGCLLLHDAEVPVMNMILPAHSGPPGIHGSDWHMYK